MSQKTTDLRPVTKTEERVTSSRIIILTSTIGLCFKSQTEPWI